MFVQRALARGTARLPAHQLRVAGRRFASTESPFAAERRHVKEHAAGTTDLWRKISIYACIPALFIAAGNAYYLWNAHWEHWSHLPPLEERTEYPYQNIRTKNFPWGNGDQTLFWNSSVNYHNHDKTK